MLNKTVILLLLAAVFTWAASTGAEEFNPVWGAGDLSGVQSFQAPQKIVGTHYFYWYDYPDYHFYDNAAHTDDSLQDHFPEAEVVSFNSVEWHAQQLQDCVDAGLDFILPVYWGVVDNYFQHGIDFSVRGLGPLQTAIERRAREGKPSPKIGLFYDTSTLLPGIRGVAGRGERYDLTQPEGKDIFYRTIRDFFYQIHPRHWAAIDGRPLVVLYASAFAARHDQSTLDYVYQQFAKDFHGLRPYVIKDKSWNFNADATTQWGAALTGPNIFGAVAQIGPGYIDAAVPGRTTPVRHREDGNFYRWSWNKVLDSNARIVLVETWSEMHEGTDICESREYGRLYIDLTREYGRKFKQNEKSSETIELKYPDLLPPPPSTEGSEYESARAVRITLGEGGVSEGIKLVRGNEDGPVENATLSDQHCVRTIQSGHTYMYFSVADPFFFDGSEPLVLEYTYWDEGHQQHALEYDSHDKNAALQGAYKGTSLVTCGNTKKWVTRKIPLRDARFVNRENRGADFRFSVNDGWLAIKDVTVTKQSSVE